MRSKNISQNLNKTLKEDGKGFIIDVDFNELYDESNKNRNLLKNLIGDIQKSKLNTVGMNKKVSNLLNKSQ